MIVRGTIFGKISFEFDCGCFLVIEVGVDCSDRGEDIISFLVDKLEPCSEHKTAWSTKGYCDLVRLLEYVADKLSSETDQYPLVRILNKNIPVSLSIRDIL